VRVRFSVHCSLEEHGLIQAAPADLMVHAGQCQEKVQPRCTAHRFMGTVTFPKAIANWVWSVFCSCLASVLQRVLCFGPRTPLGDGCKGPAVSFESWTSYFLPPLGLGNADLLPVEQAKAATASQLALENV
jgi:hypothetical protein